MPALPVLGRRLYHEVIALAYRPDGAGRRLLLGAPIVTHTCTLNLCHSLQDLAIRSPLFAAPIITE